jgi:hypothetical protein
MEFAIYACLKGFQAGGTLLMDYSIFYKRCVQVDRLSKELSEFDVFVSAYNSSDRVKIVFDKISCSY